MATACNGKQLNWNSKNCNCDMCKAYEPKNIYRLKEEGKISTSKFKILDVWYSFWPYIIGGIVGLAIFLIFTTA